MLASTAVNLLVERLILPATTPVTHTAPVDKTIMSPPLTSLETLARTRTAVLTMTTRTAPVDGRTMIPPAMVLVTLAQTHTVARELAMMILMDRLRRARARMDLAQVITVQAHMGPATTSEARIATMTTMTVLTQAGILRLANSCKW